MIVSQSEFFWDLRWGCLTLKSHPSKYIFIINYCHPQRQQGIHPYSTLIWGGIHTTMCRILGGPMKERSRSTMRPNLKPMISTSYSKVDPLGLPPSWWECNIISQESRMLISHKMILFCWGRIFLRSESLDKVCIYATVYALIFLNNFVIDSPRYVCNRRSIFCFISNIQDGFL